MINIAIFASGSGSNAENIINYFKKNEDIRVKLVLSNKEDAYVLTRAKNNKIDSKFFSFSDFKESSLVLEKLQEYEIDFIVLAGFMIKISTEILNNYANKIVNIHPALLPKYGGKGMYGDNVHKTIFEKQEKESGITIHYVNRNYDEGNIIFQARCDISTAQKAEDIANKVHQLEYKYYPKIIEKIIRNLNNS